MNSAPLYQQAWPSGDYSFFQMAFVVEDIHAACRKWAEVHGVGPFHVMRPRLKNSVYRGQPTPLDIWVAVAQAGPVQIELIHQLSPEPSVYTEVFSAGTGGFHHMCTLTWDYDASLAKFRRLGYEIMGETESSDRRLAYVDTRADFGLVTELVTGSEGFIANLKALSDTCATWDGRDPVRILTRDGYRTPEHSA